MSLVMSLATAAFDRTQRWTPTYVKYLPDPEDLNEFAMLGSYSYSLQESRRRLIKKSDRIEIVEGIFETPSALSRDYLSLVYHRGPRNTKAQLTHTSSMPPEPNVAYPRKYLHGLYIDIEACYWSIMNIVGWNVDYNPGLWLSPGRKPYDYPFPEHKVGRNCLVSAGMMTGIPIYNPHKLPGDPYSTLRGGGKLRNYQLGRLIHDVLNSIAVQCIEAGAIYANKDGFIAPSKSIADACAGIITDWGLNYKIKAEGPGEVKASGTYQVGHARTLNYERVESPRPTEILFKLPYIKWLQDEFAFWASDKGD